MDGIAEGCKKSTLEIVRENTANVYRWTNGLRHLSMLHLNGRTETDVEARVARVYEKSLQRGDFYFLSGAIRFDEDSGRWLAHQDYMNDSADSAPTVQMNVIDKIKVYRSSITVNNISHQAGMCGLEGVRDKQKQSNSDLFLHEISKCSRPNGTKAGYKRVDGTKVTSLHNWARESNISTTNANMPKGILDHIVRVRTDIAHQSALNPVHARLHACLHLDGENNNSITNDSFISSVINSKSMKHKTLSTTNTTGAFKLTHKDNFRTHKTVELYPDEIEDTSRDDRVMDMFTRTYGMTTHPAIVANSEQTSDTKSISYAMLDPNESEIHEEAALVAKSLKPLTGTEIQIHDRCFNCSAVPGWCMLPILQRKGAQMFCDSNGDRLQMSLAVNNGKATLERITHSLQWFHMNQFVELLCWKLGTHDMDYRSEQNVFHTKCLPILRRIVGTRENYAQCGTFCTQPIRGSRLFSEPVYKLVSSKFHVEQTDKLFARATKRKNTGLVGEGENNKVGIKVKKLYPGQPARNESVTALYEHSSRMYVDRFDLTPPRANQM